MKVAIYSVMLFASACTAKPSPEESTMTSDGAHVSEDDGLQPAWRKGDSWAVRYRVLVPSTTKTTDGQPTWQEEEWDYRVDDISSDGAIEISARGRQRPGKPWLLRFNPSGRLRSIEPPGDEISIVSAPHFPPNEGWWDGIVTEWPLFPVGPEPSKKEFEGGTIRQQTQPIEGGWKLIVERDDELAGSRMTKTMEQTWHVGRPWWTGMSIRTRMDFRGKTSDGLEVHGELIEPAARKEP